MVIKLKCIHDAYKHLSCLDVVTPIGVYRVLSKGGGDIYISNEASGAVIMSNSILVADLKGGELWENGELRCAAVESKVTSQQKSESLTLQL